MNQLQNIASPPAKNQLDPLAFSEEEKVLIRSAIRTKYAAVSSSAAGFFTYAVGKEGAESLGYPSDILDQTPDELMNAFCGVGNPFSIAPPAPASILLDLGCGAGFDLACASRYTGAAGRLCGVDLSPEMVERARANLAAMNIEHVDIRIVASEYLPFSDMTFDMVISNGMINLSPAKPLLFGEVHRILKPGGRLQFADIVLEHQGQVHNAVDVSSWSQ